MRLSQLFVRTLRDDPAEAEMPSHRLLLRAGYVRQLGSGIYSLLPLGFRVAQRITQIIREEQDAIGAQELLMPVVHPADIWKETGRYDAVGPEMARFKDRGGRDMVLAMTHEEVIASLLRDVIRSYRQLPVQLYHFQTKFRDEPRSRGGLIRVREFTMKDAYSCDRDEAGLDVSYEAQYGAYARTFERLGLETVVVGADVGMMGGSEAHEFMVLNPAGEDTLVLCRACGYAANQQIAKVRRPAPVVAEPAPIEEVATPGTATIADLAAFLGIPASETAKAIFFVADDGRLVTAIVRGDDEVNETKLANAVSGGGLRPGTRGGDPRRRDGARLRVTDRGARHVRRGRRRRGRLEQPRRGRQPGRLPRPQRQRGPRLPARCRHRHRQRARGRPVPRLWRARDAGQRDRGRQHLQARDEVHGRARRHLPRRGRRAAPHRDGLVRDRRRAEHGLHRRGAPRRRRASSGPRRWRRTRRTSSP